MCGIVGGVGNTVVEKIDQMVALMSHRGPDHSSHWVEKDVALGHARLSIIDTGASSNQPFIDSTGRYCLVYNGEIYNYLELKQRLISDGIVFKSNGDTEVLLQALILYGADILTEIEGIFAFCLFDKEAQTMLLARDKFGVKPLYYYSESEQFMFASEFKSMLANPAFRADINFDALFRTLLFMYNPGDDTAFLHVHKVPAGCYLTVDTKNLEVKTHKYWDWPSYDPDYAQNQEPTVHERLKTAVQRQMVSDVPVGAFLSGGVDSSVICALAKQSASEHNFTTFTIKTQFDENDGFEDDLPYAEKVARYLSLDLKVREIEPDIVKLLPKTVYHLDDIHADPAAINVLLISEWAQKAGYKVLLSGSGGDDLFTGYRRHQAVHFERYWTWMPVILRTAIKRSAAKLSVGSTFGRRVRKLFQYADLPMHQRLLSYHFWSDPDQTRSLFLNPENISKSPNDFILERMENSKISDPIEMALFLERNYFLKDHNFNYTDKLSMATGVEVRVPFLDTDLVTATSRIPSDKKQKGKVGKFVLKKIAERYLPHSVVHRSKTGFGAPLRKWMRDDLSSFMDATLSETAISRRGIFNYELIKKMIEDDRNGVRDNSYTLYALICIELWFQTFVDNRDRFANAI